MRIKLTLNRPDQTSANVAVTADATATVRDVAETLFSADPTRNGAAAPENLTLQVRGESGGGGADSRVLRPDNDLTQAGLRSGSTVEIVRVSDQFMVPGADRGAAVATLRVMEGPDAGREFPLPVGTSYIGRGRDMDVRLSDKQTSKRHARIVVGESIEIHDLDSANGLVMGGQAVTRAMITSSDMITIGNDVVSVIALHRTTSIAPTSPAVEFNRSPRVVTRFGEHEIKAPKPPEPPRPRPLPWLVMLVPVVMGLVVFLVFQNPRMLLFMFMGPMFMIGMWWDRKVQSKKEYEKASEQFVDAVEYTQERIRRTHAVERAVRVAETPSLAEAIDNVRRLGGLMWTHRPEHRGFLTVRLGVGRAPARTTFAEPRENNALPEHWEKVLELKEQCVFIDDVPSTAALRFGGSVGIAGRSGAVEGVARSVILQLLALHSPAEVVITALTSNRSRQDWEWLQWAPHTGSPHSPLGAGDHLAADPGQGAALLTRLEELIEARGMKLDGPPPLEGERDAQKDREEKPPRPILPSVVVLVEDDAPLERSRLVRLVERGPSANVHVVWVAPTVEQLPAACRTFVVLDNQAGGDSATTGQVHYGLLSFPVRCETADLATAHEIARILSPVVDVGAPVSDETDLPRSVSYLALAGTEVASEANSIVDRWKENLSLTPRDGSPPVRRKKPTNLRGLVGHNGIEPFYLDLRTQGPHALVGGTTGAGKSEFLQSWVMGMAAAHSPDRVTFLFVDYKGGAAFADCVHLPHTVGLVTDLSQHLVRRALSSLRAELHYREHLLNRKKAKDLASLEKTGDPDAPPSLIIVVDEFAALVGEVPEFVDGVVDVAQRGRSLGLHLILATQRPAGVIKDNLRANTNLRIALRMADESDSKDVLGDAMAAHFAASIPGRGAAKTGPGRITTFQTGYAGGWTSDEPEPTQIDVEELDFGVARKWEMPARESSSDDGGDPGPNDISRMVRTMRDAATVAGVPEPRKPWLPELAQTYDLALLPNPRTDAKLLLGVLDDPHGQAQPTVHYEPDTDGNMAVYGTGGAGKSTTLRTIAISAGLTVRGGPTQVYGIDCGSGGLTMLENMPHVGAIIDGEDEERVTRLLRRLSEELEDRSARYAEVRAGSIVEYRKIANRPHEPRIFVLVDGFGAFRDSYEISVARGFSIFGAFTQLATDGRPVGIHIVMTGDRATNIPPSLASTVQKRIIHRMAREDDYMMLNVPKDVLSPTSAPGRAIMFGQEAQIAVLGGDSNGVVQSREMTKLEQAMERAGTPKAPGIERLPDDFMLTALPPTVGNRPTIGLRDLDISPIGLPERSPLMLSGPPGSGRTTTFVTIATSLRRTTRTRLVYFSSRRTSVGSMDLWDQVAQTPEDVQAVAKELTEALQADTFAPGSLTVMIENYTEMTGTPAEKPLEAFVKAAVRKEVMVIGEAESSTWSKAFALAGPFKSGRNGILMTPGDMEGDTLLNTPLGRLRRQDFPPGRGFLIAAGRAAKIHVAQPG
ncbi:FtsK/SpoIIIE domain-containing protein [Myceligenerans xiligouense]|uniref:S-DNA-T family DNA segregation ATPase FtsK/SpoIIIE n=1 Tax=Myceligenerans xiligouense TaxID=253184 RepID=A0A3N4YQP0_9MICO|nr:FtsK/SpoIIIE domain-containing protein [Myceligenerans xiligouense]RPF22923.1 S-DNA-T family DNA segregation ATPase FtsK/SpoIIIE [Myceligenerans xiligouense]